LQPAEADSPSAIGHPFSESAYLYLHRIMAAWLAYYNMFMTITDYYM
jgi:hypothetical protein